MQLRDSQSLLSYLQVVKDDLRWLEERKKVQDRYLYSGVGDVWSNSPSRYASTPSPLAFLMAGCFESGLNDFINEIMGVWLAWSLSGVINYRYRAHLIYYSCHVFWRKINSPALYTLVMVFSLWITRRVRHTRLSIPLPKVRDYYWCGNLLGRR